MSANSQSHHFWLLPENDLGYYQDQANYYVKRNIGDHFVPHHASAFIGPSLYIEDPYLLDVYAATNYNRGWYYYYYYQPTSEYVDDHVYVATDDPFPFIMSTNLQSRNPSQLGQDHLGYHQAPANYHYFSRNIGDHYFAPHDLDHNSAFTGPRQTFNGQSSFDHIEDPHLWDDGYNQPVGEFVDGVYVTTESEPIGDVNDTTESEFIDTTDLIDILQFLVANLEGNEDEEEATEEIIENLMKTRIHCGTENGGEMCVICQCEYVNDETGGTLECKHEFHAGCIEQWLLRGKKTCPICRSSVLPSQTSQEHSL